MKEIERKAHDPGHTARMSRRHGLRKDLAKHQYQAGHDQGGHGDSDFDTKEVDREPRSDRSAKNIHDIVAEQNRHEQSRRRHCQIAHGGISRTDGFLVFCVQVMGSQAEKRGLTPRKESRSRKTRQDDQHRA